MHGDLKLSNIAVTAALDPYLLDVECIVRVPVDGAERDTPAGFRYTPEYAPPEVLKRQAVSAGTDLYALGVIVKRLVESVRTGVTFAPVSPSAPLCWMHISRVAGHLWLFGVPL